MPGTTKEIQGVIPWNGKGNYNQNADVTLAGKTGSGSVTSTYTVDSKGRFSRLYKGFVAALRQAFLKRQLCFRGDLKNLAQPQAFAAGYGHSTDKTRQDWVVYLKHPFGGNIWAATPIAWPFQPSSRLLHQWPS